MESSEKFCLRWNDFESNISKSFRELRDDRDFFDVTIACDDEQVQAHKVILSACSPFFKTLLKRNPHQHPLVYLRGVQFSELTSVLNFMYHGEVNVAQEELNNFLAVAEDLQIKGLTQNNSSSTKRTPKTLESNSLASKDKILSDFPPQKKPKVIESSISNNVADDDDDIQEVHPVKSEPSETNRNNHPEESNGSTYQTNSNVDTISRSLVETENYAGEDFGEFDNYAEEGFDNSIMGQMPIDGNKDTILDNLIENITVRKRHPVHGVVHECTVCHKVLKKKNKMKSHAEIHLKGFSHQCSFCGKHYKTRPSLKVHISTTHKLEKDPQEVIIPVDMESILGLH